MVVTNRRIRGQVHPHPRRRASDVAGPAASKLNALVLATPAMSERPMLQTVRHDAGFIAHLIASNARVPQTRRFSRATPQEAVAAYRATQRKTAFT